jgi:protoporphyrinogen oxidase
MSCKIGVVGGGVLGLTLALRLAKRGHRVELFEASPQLGGLATWHDYGPFTWDRFYHCILPADTHLLGLLGDLGLGEKLDWRQTGTGYYARGRMYPMSRSYDYLKFPLLSLADKARVGATVAYAALAADPLKLYGISAEDWLVKWCGRRGYEVFWRPLLKAKFGPFYDRVAAVFIWATLTRLFGARSGAASKEKLGYVRGGYRAILERFESELSRCGAIIHKRAPIRAIRKAGPERAAHCEVTFDHDGQAKERKFDQVFFTGPTRAARAVVSPSLVRIVERAEREHPASSTYLGVACMVLALRRSLTPYYVLNIGDEGLDLTGVIEMTNLVRAEAETTGLSLVYVPKYVDSADPLLDARDVDVERSLWAGIMRIIPDLRPADVVYRGIHRAKYVQPLPLVRHTPGGADATPVALVPPFQILNTSMLRCATLNNDEVVSFVDRFVERACEPLASANRRMTLVPGDQVA